MTQAEFIFDFLAPHSRLEFSIGAFCEANNIRHSFCKKLYGVAEERVKEAKDEYYRSVSIQKSTEQEQSPSPKAPNASFILLGGEEQSGPKHLIRHFVSQRSFIQFQQLYLRKNMANEMVLREKSAIAELLRHLDVLRERIFIKRLIFIHSTLFIYQNTHILESLLARLKSSGLYWETDMICVLHYGHPLPDSLRNNYPDVTYIHMSKNTALFEIPTLRVMQQIAMQLQPIEKADTHVLYLHTLGQSYFMPYEQLEDWRNMMLYFLVDTYFDRNYHLLASGVYDLLGVNYERNPRRFHGNFWWTTAEYLASISPFALDLLHSNFLEIDHFIFQTPHTRVYLLHNADLDHHHIRYPPFCYRRLTMDELLLLHRFSQVGQPDSAILLKPPSFSIWSEMCHNEDKYEYLHLHHPELIPEALYEPGNKLGVDAARCLSLDLTTS